MKNIFILTPLLAWTLTACGGSSPNDVATRLTATTPAGIAEFSAARSEAQSSFFRRINERYEPANAENIPTTGSATYNGFVVIQIPDDETATEILGVAVTNLNFADNTVTGQASDFVSREIRATDSDAPLDDPELFEGSIALGDGTIARDEEPSLSAQMVGTLRSDTKVVEVDTHLRGSTIGSNHDAIGLQSYYEADANRNFRVLVNGVDFMGEGVDETAQITVLGER